MPTPYQPSLSVQRALRRLGADIRLARERRLLPAAVVAERAFTSRPTLRRIENGDYRISIGIYAAVLQALGFLDMLSEVAAAQNDEIGLALEQSERPKRVRIKRMASQSHEKHA